MVSIVNKKNRVTSFTEVTLYNVWQKQEVLPSIPSQERTAFKAGLDAGLVLLPYGGESGIRTPGTLLTLACFLDKFLKPNSDNSPKAGSECTTLPEDLD